MKRPFTDLNQSVNRFNLTLNGNKIALRSGYHHAFISIVTQI
ncbi:hypothetical protein DFQ12_2998 [Sphingobacterium detergens]|uniref:Uncharacterized protein n=1 Tax=Sphingobacterium detergens TaxID=1145106 RepID=A0A420B7X5_SPHD1|nr:hypothetical protein DFQ12_2998 [Sphingobacterium detergens]